MRDETLIEPFAAKEYFVDGFTDYHMTNGILRCVGYRQQPPSRMNGRPLNVVIFRVAIPMAGATDAMVKTKACLNNIPMQVVEFLPQGKLSS